MGVNVFDLFDYHQSLMSLDSDAHRILTAFYLKVLYFKMNFVSNVSFSYNWKLHMYCLVMTDRMQTRLERISWLEGIVCKKSPVSGKELFIYLLEFSYTDDQNKIK